MQRSLWMALALVGWALVGWALVGCASAPRAYSARSAASLDAPAAPRPVIGRALAEEPPAPGASTEGWTGLAGPEVAPAAMHHHHHHPGMVMPAPSEGDAHAH